MTRPAQRRESPDRHVFPTYQTGERRADALVQWLSVALAVVAAGILIASAVPALPAVPVASLAIYAVGLVGVFACSLAYHLIEEARPKEILRRLDHAAIFVMIAGSYTPLAVVAIGGTTGLALAALVWTVAAAGIALKLRYPRRYERAAVVLYLAQGWTVLAAAGPLWESVPTPAFVLLAVGGVLYTIGVSFHLWRRLPYQNAIWHGFVLVAAACHYLAIFDAVVLA